MKIIPRGSRRQMVSQTFMQDATDFNETPDIGSFGDIGGQQGRELLRDDENGGGGASLPGNPQADNNSANSIDSYIFEKLQGFGYPPRRLHEFEDEFVKENIFPGEHKEVTIIIPDRYYGSKQRINGQDFNQIIKEIQEKFGFMFLGGKREAKKIEMNFSSQESQTEEDEEGITDELDEVYGTPKKNKKNQKTKAKIASVEKASTKELILEEMSKLATVLGQLKMENESDTKSI